MQESQRNWITQYPVEAGTPGNPDAGAIIQAIAAILHVEMFDHSSGKELDPNNELYYFSEEKYIEERPEEFDEKRKEKLRTPPTQEDMAEYLQALYDCAKFSPECVVFCLIYLHRLMCETGMRLHPMNWRPLILCAILVAQKVWDDKYLTNGEFSLIYPFFVTEEINKLERKFLELIKYNVMVKAALYTKYYFELREVFKKEDEFKLQQLEGAVATAFDERASRFRERYHGATKIAT